MSIALFSLCSSLHAETETEVLKEQFIQEVQTALGEPFEFFGNDFSSYGTHDVDLIFIRTGGTEGLFRELGLKGDIKLLTSGQSNSLAASMEILAWLRQKGQMGEILHGTAEQIAQRIKLSASSDQAKTSFIKPLEKMDFGGVKLGVIGKPSDWLIASEVDYKKAKEKLNVEFLDIPMSELLSELEGCKVDMRSFQGSEAIYEALLKIVEKYGLGGLTLRCFDLLDTVHNTGCLALARLNAIGIPSSCEGDIPALLSMLITQKRTGCPGFQCNLSKIDGDKFLFAHCTVPLTMVDSYCYATHFESGLGTAIKGELPLGPASIFRISPDLESCIDIPARIVSNESRPLLCRTQIIVEAKGAASYFLQEPLANHHIISWGSPK